MTDKLTDLIRRAADKCEQDGTVIDGEHGGAVHKWVLQNCQTKPGQDFFIVFLITAELADREARREGFDNQGDRAAKSMCGKRAVDAATISGVRLLVQDIGLTEVEK